MSHVSLPLPTSISDVLLAPSLQYAIRGFLERETIRSRAVFVWCAGVEREVLRKHPASGLVLLRQRRIMPVARTDCRRLLSNKGCSALAAAPR